MPDALPTSIVHLPALTRADVAMLEHLVQCMIIAGLWISGDRSRNPHCDCIEVLTQETAGPALCIGVLVSGRYFYMDHQTSAVVLGETLDDVLSQVGLSAGN